MNVLPAKNTAPSNPTVVWYKNIEFKKYKSRECFVNSAN
jgi:hypothetical protein